MRSSPRKSAGRFAFVAMAAAFAFTLSVAAASAQSGNESSSSSQRKPANGAQSGGYAQSGGCGQSGGTSKGMSFHSGKSSSGGTAMSRSFGSSNSGGDQMTSGSTSRSVSFSENGKTVSIQEDSRSGIIVTVTETVDGKEKKTVTQAANAAELAKKNPAAYDLYQRHLGGNQGASAVIGGGAKSGGASNSSHAHASKRSSNKDGGGKAKSNKNAAAGQNAEAKGRPDIPNDAQKMLRQHLLDLRQQNAGNPQMTEMLDQVLGQLDNPGENN
jgi:hypothetical protein